MQFPDNWFNIFDVVDGDVVIKNTVASGDNPLTGGKELNDLQRDSVTSGDELRIVLGS